MSKKEVKTDKAPKAIGPYSQAVFYNNFVFASGQIPLTHDGTLIEGDFEKEVRQIFSNLKAVLEAEGLDFSNVLMVNVYLSDMNLFSELNKIYEEYFKPPYPARAVVEVSKLPKNVRVEISLIAGK